MIVVEVTKSGHKLKRESPCRVNNCETVIASGVVERDPRWIGTLS